MVFLTKYCKNCHGENQTGCIFISSATICRCLHIGRAVPTYDQLERRIEELINENKYLRSQVPSGLPTVIESVQ